MEKDKTQQNKLKKMEVFGDQPELGMLAELHDLNESVRAMAEEKTQEMAVRGTVRIIGEQGPAGEPGRAPTDEELLALIRPLIPEVKDGYTPTREELVALIRPLIPTVRDGETPSDERLLELIEPLIPVVKDGNNGMDGKDGSPDTGEQIIDKINADDSEKKIKREKVEGLDDEIKGIKNAISNIPRGGSGKKITSVKKINLTSQVNGVLKSFALPKDTLEVLGIFGTQFPIIFDPSVDYILIGNTLTLGDSVLAPATGQTLWALIVTAFY